MLKKSKHISWTVQRLQPITLFQRLFSELTNVIIYHKPLIQFRLSDSKHSFPGHAWLVAVRKYAFFLHADFDTDWYDKGWLCHLASQTNSRNSTQCDHAERLLRGPNISYIKSDHTWCDELISESIYTRAKPIWKGQSTQNWYFRVWWELKELNHLYI